MVRITRREMARRLAGTVTAAFAVPGALARTVDARAQPRRARPNVLLVIMDDMRWDLMGCAGHPFIRTPALDRVAREGARFANAFVCLSLCSPSRASFLTGLYPHVHGVLGNRTPLDFDRLTTFPQRLQRAGYRTAMFGKWHMGVDADPKPGFDHWACFRGQGTYFEPQINVNGELTKHEGFTDDVTTTMAAEWMTADTRRPFTCVLGFKSCHSPFELPPRAASLYSDVKIRRPPSFEKATPAHPAWTRPFDDAGHTPYSRIPIDELTLRFARLVTAADDNVGRLLAALARVDQLDNTVVIFTSDNGFLLHEHGLYDKRAMYEESIRIPLLVRYPPLVRRAVVNDMALNIDLAPTLYDLIGVGGADETQGTSLLAALSGGRRTARSIFFYQYDRETPYSTPSLMGVRTPAWKLVKYQEEGQSHELYDLKKDRFEMVNGFENPRLRTRRVALERELDRLAPLAQIRRPIR